MDTEQQDWLRRSQGQISHQLLGARTADVEGDQAQDQDQRMKDSAAASRVVEHPQELAVDDLPTITVWVLPSSRELMKSPAAGMKVSSVPATTPGSESGQVTLRKSEGWRTGRRRPRSSRGSSRSSAA